MTGKRKFIAGLGGLVCGLALFATSAQATPLGLLDPCTGDFGVIANNVSPNAGCGIDPTETQDSVSVVNRDDGYFAITNWTKRGKYDDIGDASEGWESGNVEPIWIDFTGDNLAVSGDWSIDPQLWAEVESLMFVLKGGTNPLVAYLIDNGETSGTYTTPFTAPPFDLPGQSTAQDISHISVYEVRKVPEPSVLVLLALGLLAMGWVGRRRRDDAAAA